MTVSPPRPKMPQLNALRAFEAAARLGSISQAAQELFVTPAAVAQHVKSLEAWAGAQLFVRNPQGVELTPLGASVLADFEAAFDALGNAVHKLRNNAAPLDIRIAALPSIAQHWLSPCLPEIRDTHPEVSISVTALEQCPNLTRDPFDLAIFYDHQPETENTIVVSQDVIFPVCSNGVAERLKSVKDLAEETFLHDSSWRDDWRYWVEGGDVRQNLLKSGPEYSLYSLALEECRNGAGVLIGHLELVRDDLEKGILVEPFDKRVTLERWMTMRYRSRAKSTPVFQQILDMLLKFSGD